MKKPTRIELFKAVIFTAPLLVAAFLLLQFVAWRGTLTVEYDFSDEDNFVSEWYPGDRVTDRLTNERNNRSFQGIHGEPAYIDVEVPRAFDTVDMTIEYRNPDHAIVDAGIVASRAPFVVDFFPFQNTIIDEALTEWGSAIEDGDVTLLQSPDAKQYESIPEFLAQKPRQAQVGTYFYTGLFDDLIPGYQKQPGQLTIDRAFLGQHEFVTYIQDEPLHADFSFVDMNSSSGADPIRIEVYDGTVLIHEELINDDGITDVAKIATEERTATVHLESLPEGMYRYNVIIGDNVALTKIQTEQHKFVARNRVHTINSDAYSGVLKNLAVNPTTVYTNAPFVDVIPDKKRSIGEVTVNGEVLDGVTAGDRFHWVNETDRDQVKVQVPEREFEVLTQGYFSFTEDAFFDPDGGMRPIAIEDEIENFDYVLYEGYVPPEIQQNRFTQTVSFDITAYPIDRKALTFAIQAPYIDAERNRLDVESVQFDFRRESLTTRIWKRLRGQL
jgi:hypothetical protein